MNKQFSIDWHYDFQIDVNTLLIILIFVFFISLILLVTMHYLKNKKGR